MSIISVKLPPKLLDASAAPRELTTDQSQFTGAKQHDEAFTTIQYLVIKHPVLKVYNTEEGVTTQKDAYFKVDSQEVPFASTMLSQTESKSGNGSVK